MEEGRLQARTKGSSQASKEEVITMSEQRQFCPQLPGSVLSNYVADGSWQVIANADYDGVGCAFYNIQEIDLRGLLSGNESGLYMDSISLQESEAWNGPLSGPEDNAGVMCYDMLTTVRPTEHTIANTWVRPDTRTSVCPGFLFTTDALTNNWPPSEQTLNPSQVIWGLWRAFITSSEYKPSGLWGVPYRVLQSGYFGQGDYAVAPTLYWTRMVFTLAESDAIATPSANLVCNARAENITTPMEISQMMRAAQR